MAGCLRSFAQTLHALLHIAAFGTCTELADALNEAGQQASRLAALPGPNNITAAHYAARSATRCTPAKLALLAAHGDTLDQSDDDGFTPLHIVVTWAPNEPVALALAYTLVRRGVRCSPRTRDGRTPTAMATKAGHTRLLAALNNDAWSGERRRMRQAARGVLSAMRAARTLLTPAVNDRGTFAVLTHWLDVELLDALVSPAGPLVDEATIFRLLKVIRRRQFFEQRGDLLVQVLGDRFRALASQRLFDSDDDDFSKVDCSQRL